MGDFPIDSSGFDLSGLSDIGAGATPNFGSDPLGLFGGSPSTSSGQGTWGTQMFLDTTTGQVLSGDQLQQSDPNGFRDAMAALGASVDAPSPVSGSGSSGTGLLVGLSGAQLAQLASLLGVSGAALAGAITKSVQGSSVPKVPGLTPSEQQLLGTQQQLYGTYQQLLAQQLGVGQAVLPSLLQRAGFVPNPQGGMTDLYAQGIQNATLGNLQNAQAGQQMTQNALTGNLEQMNPALTQALNDQQTLFEAKARQQFGPSYQQSTPYQWAQYYQNMARTNALAANQLNYATTGQNIANQALTGATTQTSGTPSAINAAFGSGSQYPQATAAGSFPFENQLSQNLLNYRGALNQYNANNALTGSLVGGIGQAIGQATPLLFGTPPAGSPGLLTGLG